MNDRRRIFPKKRARNPLRRAALRLCFSVSIFIPASVSTPTTAVASPASSLKALQYRAFDRALNGWDIEAARAQISENNTDTASLLRRGMIAFYEADYRRAHALFQNSIAAGDLDEQDLAHAKNFLERCNGEIEVFGDRKAMLSPDGRVEVIFANPQDEVIAPYLFDAMQAAYDRLGKEIGVFPDSPIRFEFLDTPGDLAKVTELPLDAVYTTGTVGITKYRRIMMVSPRVMLMGYPWLDTAVHEYVHYLVAIRTQNLAPVWLQEGLAKHYETRWRLDGPAQLDGAVAKLLHDALRDDKLITLEQMHPSIALLPSQEQAALAYAEVETMIGHLRRVRGPASISRLLDGVGNVDNAKAALAQAYGGDFDRFYEEWKTDTRIRTSQRSADGSIRKIQFKDAEDVEPSAEDPSLLGDIFSHLGGGKARQHARIGVLLQLRGHNEAAMLEYQKAAQSDPEAAKDPRLARRLGELYLEHGRPAAALPLLLLAGKHDPENANIATAELQAALALGKRDAAENAAKRAIRNNPMIPQLHCALAKLTDDPLRQIHETKFCPDTQPDAQNIDEQLPDDVDL